MSILFAFFYKKTITLPDKKLKKQTLKEIKSEFFLNKQPSRRAESSKPVIKSQAWLFNDDTETFYSPISTHNWTVV